MYSFRTVVIALVIITTLSISIDLISESEEIKEGKINLVYVALSLGVAMIGFLFLAFLIMFVKYIWVFCAV